MHVYGFDQLCVTRFEPDALHCASARDHAGQDYVVCTPSKVNTSITFGIGMKEALNSQDCRSMLIDLPHLIITKVGGHRRPLGYFSKHNDKRGPRARASFLNARLLVFCREKCETTPVF